MVEQRRCPTAHRSWRATWNGSSGPDHPRPALFDLDLPVCYRCRQLSFVPRPPSVAHTFGLYDVCVTFTSWKRRAAGRSSMIKLRAHGVAAACGMAAVLLACGGGPSGTPSTVSASPTTTTSTTVPATTTHRPLTTTLTTHADYIESAEELHAQLVDRIEMTAEEALGGDVYVASPHLWTEQDLLGYTTSAVSDWQPYSRYPLFEERGIPSRLFTDVDMITEALLPALSRLLTGYGAATAANERPGGSHPPNRPHLRSP